MKRGALHDHLVPAPDPRSVRAWKIFGAVALTLGTVLILLIIFSAIFGYR